MVYFLFIIGIIFGSFLCVVGIRIPNGESIIKPGSHCSKCGHFLEWYENIPLLSYIFLGGSCKSCKEKIPFSYFLMELLSGCLFALSYKVFGININLFYSLIICCLIITIYVSDSNYMIISDEPLVVAGILIIILKFIDGGFKALGLSLLSGLIMFIVGLLLLGFGYLVFKQEALGGGDIKLTFIAGMILGVKFGIVYIVLASFLAFPYAIYISLKNKDHMLPFGPFLISSLYIVYINMGLFGMVIDKIF